MITMRYLSYCCYFSMIFLNLLLFLYFMLVFFFFRDYNFSSLLKSVLDLFKGLKPLRERNAY